MKRNRFLSVILSIVMCVSVLVPCLPVSAEENTAQQPAQSVDMNAEIQSSNSFGELLADSLTDAQKEQLNSTGTHIVSIEMDGDIAKVRYQARQNADLVIGIYDESGETLLGSGHAAVLPEEHDAEIPVEVSEWPEYYLVRGFLTEPVTLAPLSPVFECNLYTKEMTEFLTKTTADFDDTLVLNLDDNNSTNFAVYKENVIQLHPEEGFDKIVSADDENNIFVFENPDAALLALKKDDIFAYETDETIVIAKVAALEQDGSRVTVTGSDFSAEDVFSHIRIDSESDMTDAELNPAEQIEIEEAPASKPTEKLPPRGIRVQSDDGEGEIGLKIEKKFVFKKKETKIGDIEEELKNSESKIAGAGETKLSVEATLKLTASAKFYVSLKESYVEVSTGYDLGVFIDCSGRVSLNVEFGKAKFPVAKFIDIDMRPSISLEFSGAMNLGFHVKGEIGRAHV